MTDQIERRIGRLTVRIDRNLCVGFGDCIDLAADLFELDDDGVVRFVDAHQAGRASDIAGGAAGDAADAAADRADNGDADDVAEERLRAVCGSCPVDALSLLDQAGRQLAP